MNVSVLEREAITWDTPLEHWDVPAGDDALSDELAEEACDVLGYTTLAKKKRESRRHRSLEQTLAEYDIRPFTAASVRKYKQACEVNPSRFWPTIVESVIGLSCILMMGALGTLFGGALLMETMMSFYSALIIVGGFVVITLVSFLSGQGLVQRQWKMRELASYDEPVPEFALQTALDIKKKHPEVSFYVCVLEENRIVVDPFLVMRVHNGNVIHDYYIEVWNESAFTGQREA